MLIIINLKLKGQVILKESILTWYFDLITMKLLWIR